MQGPIPAIPGGDLEISDRTALDLEHRVLDPGDSDASDAIDLAVESTEVLSPLVDALLPGSEAKPSSSSNYFEDSPDRGSSSRTGNTEKSFVGDNESSRNDRSASGRQDLAARKNEANEDNKKDALGGKKIDDHEDQTRDEKQGKDDTGEQTLDPGDAPRDGQVRNQTCGDQTLAPRDEEQAQDPCDNTGDQTLALEEQATDQTLASRDEDKANDTSDQILAPRNEEQARDRCDNTGDSTLVPEEHATNQTLVFQDEEQAKGHRDQEPRDEELAGDPCDAQTSAVRDEGQTRDYFDDTDDHTKPEARNGPSCSRSSTFSDRSVESCDSFVSADSRLQPFAEREELFKMFETFDENGDGRISREELGNTMRKLGFEVSQAELESMLVAVDSDGDGFVDFEEFLDLYSTLYYDEKHRATVDGDNERELLEAFCVFDKNKDGYISVTELQAVLSSLGLKEGAKLSDCQKMIKAVDADGDGQVSFEEFRTMMSSTLLQQQD